MTSRTRSAIKSVLGTARWIIFGITLAKVKSGQTFQPGWLHSLNTVQRHMSQPTRNAVLYGGDLSAQRTNAELVGWRDLVLAG